jgi:iron(III) transport system ATP-binding protein
MKLIVRDLVKTYGKPPRTPDDVSGAAVASVSFSVDAGEFFTLLGPSGCGKTTTLRCAAGLEMPDFGEISLDGRLLYSDAKSVYVPGNLRGLGMVFQTYAVWPHMTVFDNVAFPLQCRSGSHRLAASEIRRRVGAMLEVVRLSSFSERRATALSGGQQQRLALARALVMEPPALLLDEPLSNLDANLRTEMRAEITKVQREFGITTIYVTHDQAEALAMSSMIAVLRDGKIEQIGDPQTVYHKPRSRFVADFLGASNLIKGTVTSTDAIHADGFCCTAKTAFGDLRAVSADPVAIGNELFIAVRPEMLTLSGSAESHVLSGRIQRREFLGDSVLMVVSTGAESLRVRCEPGIACEVGSVVHLGMKELGIVLQ